MTLTPAQLRVLAQIHVSGAWQPAPDLPIQLGRPGGDIAHRATVAALISRGHVEQLNDDEGVIAYRPSATGLTELEKHPQLVKEARIEDVGLRHGLRAPKQ
jgi:hypothetical protein